MKTLITLFHKVLKAKKQVEFSEVELDAWIVSIRQAPQKVGSPILISVRNPRANNNGLEEDGNLVLA